ncbi:hypothetical protein CRE_11075 [Caenorhabditis remanei]|uniref:Uncharacterized protein n=1 Tax=Caenorhabditis remanei TaxID=31234 RepID=E3M5E4_CAERE|nr:hypothetical protein CRE_11075 [Caenorhabditis remanei]
MLFRVLLLVLASANLVDAYFGLDQSEQIPKVYTCEIDGIVDNVIHQLHGNLVNCQNPPMECWIDPHEFLIKTQTLVNCQVPNDDWIFYDEKECAFQFYYRRSDCFYENRCYSMSMICVPVISFTASFKIAAGFVVLLAFCLLFLVTCCIRKLCGCKTEAKTIPQKSQIVKLREIPKEEPMRLHNNFVPLMYETAI